MTLSEKIRIMTARQYGAVIEASPIGKNRWELCPDPGWNWKSYEYRIQPSYIFYNDNYTKEFIYDQWLHGPQVKKKLGQELYDIGINHRGCVLVSQENNEGRIVDSKYLFEHFVWKDNSPCGIKNHN